MKIELNSSLPKVSIITVCYNSAKTLVDTIESVLSQDYPNIEYIVIDGASKDSTLEIINRYENRISKFISEPDKGIYDAMNKGLSLATGEIVALLNSDDFYIDKHSISNLVTSMLKANTDSVFADLLIVDPDNTNKVLRYYKSSSWNPNRFRFGWMPAHPTFLVKRSCYLKHGNYSLNYKIAADFEMMIRLLYSGKISYTCITKPMVRMRAGGLSTQGIRSTLKLNQEIVKACKEHKIWTSLPIVLLKMPMKLTEVLLPKLFHYR